LGSGSFFLGGTGASQSGAGGLVGPPPPSQLAGCSDHASSPLACSRRLQVAPVPLVPGLRRRWELRVSSPLASFSAAVFEAPGCPGSSRSAALPDELSGCPDFLIFRLAGDGVSSCLAPRVLQRCVPPRFGFPRLPASCRTCRCNPRVAPVRASSGFSGDGASSFLASRILRRLWRPKSGLPRILLLQPAFPMSLRVAPAPASSGRADGELLGFPFRSFPRPRRLVALRVAPVTSPSGVSVSASSVATESCFNGWIDDDSPA